ncbi:MAG: hypothetical protein ACK5KP_04445 [Paludibacteraceae bacterium]
MKTLFGNIETDTEKKKKGNPYRSHGKFSTKEDAERYQYKREIKRLNKVVEYYKGYAKRLERRLHETTA